MVRKCCVDACHSAKSPKLLFHRFPMMDAERLRLWLFALDMDVNTPLYVIDNLLVCQKHFEPTDYYYRNISEHPTRRKRLLKLTAVPTQFKDAHTAEAGDPTATSDIYLDNPVSMNDWQYTSAILPLRDMTGPPKQSIKDPNSV